MKKQWILAAFVLAAFSFVVSNPNCPTGYTMAPTSTGASRNCTTLGRFQYLHMDGHSNDTHPPCAKHKQASSSKLTHRSSNRAQCARILASVSAPRVALTFCQVQPPVHGRLPHSMKEVPAERITTDLAFARPLSDVMSPRSVRRTT